MAKFYGKIGFFETTETEPGIWEEVITEKPYYGDITRNISRYQQTDNVNGSISINNTISIVADPYATNNFQNMIYVIFNGVKWHITSAEVEYPRIILSIGGLYSEDEE